ncbi:YdeI/OmpD-associated family protein [Pseudorhizobium flavum]|uniref:Uncharacterized protein YdeI (YjbR/CyaY-like superfamily) n=1 Tax=Pseudorhizobium flavum TaxID=1335061 RepID=A0A7W9YYK9_9HYPH|nr:YdeI/OmpD-associated family protein [Pseudorhizobium flavum]MBB6179426.1 uncharacterized protein YdeI (YjbR/CyaY-like superfamily) [Pseudorhizobium flavum]CAD6605503.1 hypothetical protein RFYW14_01696 [Pseudorhizobium flavum]
MGDDERKIDAFFSDQERWREELLALRKILLDCGLVETFKWSSPCYTVDDGNVALLWGFKDAATLGFFKGVLLKDPEKILIAPGENSRSSRILRFTGTAQIAGLEKTIKAYVREAMELERAGARVDMPKDDLDYPEELVCALGEDPELQAAFEGLTPGRRRGYVLHFSQAKQSQTRRARIEKHRSRILAGKGMHDR